MKSLIIVLLSFLSITASAAFKSTISGNIEAQMRHAKNNPEAKEDLAQDWEQENFYLVYGNLNGKVEMGTSRIESNVFVRHSKSDLYDPSPTPFGKRNSYAAVNIYTFPNRLVVRDMFKLQHVERNSDQQTEAVINKLYYEWEQDDHRFMAGRIYINYGTGEIFNPINPFNQPTGLTSISQVAQGNDGVSFTFFVNDAHTVQFLLLGDKSYDEYSGRVTRTLWAHGDYQISNKLQIEYVIGEDLERHKIGGQVSYQLDNSMIFSQILFQSQNVKNKESSNLWDLMAGYDQQLNSKWHIRLETGHQKRDRFLTVKQLGERFLPTEYFAALANIYEIHPLIKLSGTVINDIKSGFTYLVAKGTYNMTQNMEAEIFAFSPVGKGGEPDNAAQSLVTTDVGLSLRSFF